VKKTTITVEGMSCGHCEARVEKAAKSLAGITSAKADHLQNSLTVEYDPDQVTVDRLVAAVKATGYKVNE